MVISYFPKYCARNADLVLKAMTQGFRHWNAGMVADSLQGDAVLLWSQLWAGRMRPNFEIYQHYRRLNKPVIFVDAGVIQRSKTWRIWIDQQTDIYGVGHDASRRNFLGLEVRTWRYDGRTILIALQRPDSNQWQRQPDIASWTLEVVRILRQHSQRPIKIRSHPRYPVCLKTDVVVSTPKKITGTYDDFDFDEALDDAWAVINWNSSPAVTAALRGIPVFTGPESRAAPVATLDLSLIENPLRPDREQWANDLAWTEWTVEEIQQGLPQGFIINHCR
jgi:hypothetical protein